MARQQKYEWFIETKNTYTEKAVAEGLSYLGQDNGPSLIPCQDGRERSLWFCDYSFAERLWKSKKNDDELDFMVFRRRIGKQGKGPVKPSSYQLKLFQRPKRHKKKGEKAHA